MFLRFGVYSLGTKFYWNNFLFVACRTVTKSVFNRTWHAGKITRLKLSPNSSTEMGMQNQFFFQARTETSAHIKFLKVPKHRHWGIFFHTLEMAKKYILSSSVLLCIPPEITWTEVQHRRLHWLKSSTVRNRISCPQSNSYNFCHFYLNNSTVLHI